MRGAEDEQRLDIHGRTPFIRSLWQWNYRKSNLIY